MRNQQVEGAASEVEADNIVQFAGSHRKYREPPPSDDELAEYRRIRARLLTMLDEWETLRGPAGCPVMQSILGPPKP